MRCVSDVYFKRTWTINSVNGVASLVARVGTPLASQTDAPRLCTKQNSLEQRISIFLIDPSSSLEKQYKERLHDLSCRRA